MFREWLKCSVEADLRLEEVMGKLPNVTTGELQDLGLTKGQAGKLRTLMQLFGRIIQAQSNLIVKVNDSHDVWNACQGHYFEKTTESMLVLAVDQKGFIVRRKEVAVGNVNCIHIDALSLFKVCIEESCTRLILTHNHPSGDANPSPDDLALTKRVHDMCDVLGMNLLDHVIFGRGQFYSTTGGKLLIP